MSQPKSIVKKFCKVCHDSGKSEKEYTSHFTRESRDLNSRIICPILKALECRYCGKNGHTVKYCSVLKNKEKIYKKGDNTNKKVQMEKKETNEKINTNKFACLYEEEETETEPIKPTVSYASALKKEKIITEEKKFDTVPMDRPTYQVRRRVLDWAAECDTDSDDE